MRLALAAACTALFALSGSALPALGVDFGEAIREAKVREAAFRSVEAALASLAQETADAGALAERMLAAPETYTDPEAAARRIASEERESLARAFREQLEIFARARADTLPASWVDDVVREEAVRIDGTIDRLAGTDFTERFRAARSAAVQAQYEQVAPSFFPDAAAVAGLAETATSASPILSERVAETIRSAAATSLARDTALRIRADLNLFDEVDGTLEDEVTRAIAAGLGEFWRQEQALRRFRAGELVRSEDIALGLRTELETLARASGLPYGVFPAVAGWIEERAALLEGQQFRAHVRRQLDLDSSCPGLPPDTVAEAVEAGDTELPELFDHHRKLLQSQLAPSAAGRIAESHAEGVGAGERDDFIRHVLGMLGEDTRLADHFEEAVAACIAAPLREIRSARATAELAARHPAIADYSYEVDDDDLIGLALREGDIGAYPSGEDLHLEETRELHRLHVAALQEEALTALRAQELLTRVEERRLRFVRAVESDPNRTADRKQHYQQEYEVEVLEAWLRNRARVLLRDERGAVRHPEKYGRIFPTTAEIIGEIITLEFERPMPTATPAPTIPPSPLPPLPIEPAPPVPPRPPQPLPQPQAAGPTEFDQQAGLPQPIEPPAPLPETGGAPDSDPAEAAPGGDSCEEMLQRCLRATSVCHAAMVQCRDDPARCAAGLAQCGAAKFACEP